MNIAIALVLAFAAVVGTAALHYEAIRRLDRFARRSKKAYPALVAVISELVALHVLEISAYAIIFWISAAILSLGAFDGDSSPTGIDYFYFAAEAYASLGYGNVAPTGELRLITSIAPLNGILLLTWSGSFLFSLVEDWRGRES
jgi:hypothetical protein